MSDNGNALAGYLQQQGDVRRAKLQTVAKPKFGVPSTPSSGTFSPGGKITTPPPPVHHGGGGIGGFLGSALHEVGNAGAYIHNKTDLAAHDIEAMPTGFVAAGKALAHDSAKASYITDKALHLHTSTYEKKANSTNWETPALGKAMAKSTVESFKHPGRDPFNTFLNVAAVASLGAGAIARVGAAGKAISAADDASLAGKLGGAGKALVTKPKMPHRIINEPNYTRTKGGDYVKGSTPVQLTAAKAPLARAVQELHDRIIQRSLDKHDMHSTSLINRYAERRVGHSDTELSRRTENTRAGLPMLIGRATRFGKGLTKKEGQLALALRSWNVLPHESRDFWEQAINESSSPKKAAELADRSHALHQKGVLQVRGGKVVVNEKMYPELARADKLVKNGQDARNAVIHKYGLMSPEAMAGREALPAEIMRSEAARDARGLPPVAAGMRRLFRGEGEGYLSYKAQGLIPGDETHYFSTNKDFAASHDTGGGLHYVDVPKEIASEHHSGAGNYELPGTIATKMRKVPKEGSGVREGQGYTPLALSEKEMAQFPRPGGQGRVKGVPKNFITKTLHATGEGIRHGLVPDNTTRGIARATKQALSYQAKFEARDRAYARGSDISRHADDVLVRDPSKTARPLNSSTKQAVGQELSTLDTVGDDQTMAQRFEEKMHDVLHPQTANSARVAAPAGTRWVSKQVLGDLSKSVAPRGKLARRVDDINSAVTAATVYAKLSHVPQRLVTDATTSLVSGALTNPNTRAFVRALKHGGLSEQEVVDAAQATGTHGYQALPHQGESVPAKAATFGANLFAHHVDARFRFMNLAHEARKAGIDTVPEFRKLLAYAKDPSKRIPIQKARDYEQILRHSDRASMMYDGLTPTERATVSRALWFYPWTKSAFRYGGHVAGEHPFQAAAGANAGVQGRKIQHDVLGGLPSFEYGLIPVGGHKTSSAGWLEPFNTTGQVLEMGARPQQVIGNLNPVYQSALTAFSGLNSYGDVVPGGRGYPSLKAAAGELTAPTPEFSILHDYLDAKAAERKTRMFPHKPIEDVLTKLVVGPTYPKVTNKKALHRAHRQENGGFIDIQVPKRK